jgi:hypothetical protein
MKLLLSNFIKSLEVCRLQLRTSSYIRFCRCFRKIRHHYVVVYNTHGILYEFSCITLKMGTDLHAEMLEQLQHTT